jgi:hypothetical protein
MNRSANAGAVLRRPMLMATLVGLVAASAGLTAPSVALGVGSDSIVISQVYGGGGITGATYANDFVELFNRGAVPTSLSGWSIQYASGTGSGLFSANVVALPSAIVPVGGYFLVQLASGGVTGVGLPAPDATGTVNLGATNGKVIVTNSTVGLDCNGDPSSSPCPGIEWFDLVGYGTAHAFEGAGPAPAPSATTSVSRVDGGCQDTDTNSLDFTAGPPVPRNSVTAAAPCAAVGPSPSASAGASPGPSSDTGTVGAHVTVPSSAACLEVSTSSVDFGTLPLGSEDQPGTPDVTVTNCSAVAADILAHGTDATGTGASWSLVNSAETCADTLGVDRYRLGLEQAGAQTGLGTTNTLVESLVAGAAGTHTAHIFTACPGSTGSGAVMSMTITFLATTAGG